MRNKLEHTLLSLLLGLSILLGLSFWLNTKFGFNIFLKAHWDELAQLQATNTPVDKWFYISIGIALFIFLIGLIVIHFPHTKHKEKQQPITKEIPAQKAPAPIVNIIPETKEPEPIPNPTGIPFTRPPRLNLPKNMAQIAEKKYTEAPAEQQPLTNKSSLDSYNSTLAEIFSDAGYLVKPNPTISGFTPNLFAIGNNEVVWIGGVDCKSEDMKNAVQKLHSVFEDTLSDIPINIYPFIVDNLNKATPDESILIVPSIDVIKNFISENPADNIEEDEQESFNSYSEYIDTVIQYVKNV